MVSFVEKWLDLKCRERIGGTLPEQQTKTEALQLQFFFAVVVLGRVVYWQDVC